MKILYSSYVKEWKKLILILKQYFFHSQRTKYLNIYIIKIQILNVKI
jgi:hypothetical protein